jgi:hypothetical protein
VLLLRQVSKRLMPAFRSSFLGHMPISDNRSGSLPRVAEKG